MITKNKIFNYKALSFFLATFSAALFFLFFSQKPVIAECQIKFSNNNPKLLDRIDVTISGLTYKDYFPSYIVKHNNNPIEGKADTQGRLTITGILLQEDENDFYVYEVINQIPKNPPLCSSSLNIQSQNASCKLSVSGNSSNITVNIEQLPSLQSGVGIMWLVQQTDGSHLRGNCINGPYNPPIAVPIGQLGDNTFIFSVRYREQGWNHPLCSPSQAILCQGTIVVRGGEPEIIINPPQPVKSTIDPTCKKQGKPGSINTALGCIPVDDLNDFIGWLLKNVIFVASGIAFLLMAFGALQIITSAGSPDKMKAGSELITSALSGLLLIILSLFLLKLIGVDILRIPGFGD